MNRHELLATTTAFLTVLAMVVAGTGGVSAGISDISAQQTGQGDATTIDSCTTITEPGTYVLTTDIRNSDADTCIEIRASDVVFDGDGHLVDGPQNESAFDAFQAEVETNGTFPWEPRWESVGVAVNGSTGPSNVTVRNVEVTDWFFGVYAANGTADVSVLNATVRDSGDGISAYNAEDVVVRDGVAVGNSAGVVVDGVTDATVEGMTLSNNVDGVLAAVSTDVTVANNELTDNEDGAFVFDVSGLVVRDNVVTGSYWTAFAVYLSDGSRFADNTIADTRGNVTFDHDTADVILHETDHATFEGTTVRDSEANWTVYATNGSENVVGSNVTVENLTVAFTLSDVAFAAGERAVPTPSVDADTPVVSTSTGNESRIAIEVEWPGNVTGADATGGDATSTPDGSTPRAKR